MWLSGRKVCCFPMTKMGLETKTTKKDVGDDDGGGGGGCSRSDCSARTTVKRRFGGSQRYSIISWTWWPLLVALVSSSSSTSSFPAVVQAKTQTSTPPPGVSSELTPQFDVYRVENHTVQLGGIAFLPCVIKNLGNRSVSWVRSNDSHILTVDKEVFITDLRFATIHHKDSSTWTLQIKSVQASDAGRYECQVSTEPKLSHFVYLSVIVPRVRIFGDRDIYVKSSSTVQLKCVISQSLSPPTYIEWRRNKEERLPSSFTGLGVHLGSASATSSSSVDHRRLQTTPPEHIAEGTTMSTLTILHAKPSDSGVYTCMPAQLEPASVNLHVIETDQPALMQTSEASSPMVDLCSPMVRSLMLLLTLLAPI